MSVEQSVEWELAGETEVLVKKPAPVLLSPVQIPYDLTWACTPATAVASRRLTAWAMARPWSLAHTVQMKFPEMGSSKRYLAEFCEYSFGELYRHSAYELKGGIN
jgi:hypothetical protein